MYWDGDDLVIKIRDGRTVNYSNATVQSITHSVPKDSPVLEVTPTLVAAYDALKAELDELRADLIMAHEDRDWELDGPVKACYRTRLIGGRLMLNSACKVCRNDIEKEANDE